LPPKTDELSAPSKEYEMFVESRVWRDMREELTAWQKHIDEHLRHETDHDEWLRFQGRAQVLEEVFQLPYILAEYVKRTEELSAVEESEYGINGI